MIYKHTYISIYIYIYIYIYTCQYNIKQEGILTIYVNIISRKSKWSMYICQGNIKQENILNIYVNIIPNKRKLSIYIYIWPTVKIPVSKFLFRFYLDWTMSHTCSYLIRYCPLKTNMRRSDIYDQYSQPACITSRSRFPSNEFCMKWSGNSAECLASNFYVCSLRQSAHLSLPMRMQCTHLGAKKWKNCIVQKRVGLKLWV